jgi:hypothetical protein
MNGIAHYNDGDDNCKPCPEHMVCPGGWNVFPKDGLWRMSNLTGPNRTIVFECNPRSACLGPNASACTHDMCAVGYNPKSFGCGGCLPGYTKSLSTGSCTECQNGGPAWGNVMSFFIGSFAVGMFVYHKATIKPDSQDVASASESSDELNGNMGTFIIISNFANIVTLIDVGGGPISSYFVGWFSFDSSQATVYFCMQSFVSQYQLMLCIPLIFMLVIGVCSRLHHGDEAAKTTSLTDQSQDASEKTEVPMWIRHWLQSCIFILLYSCMSMATMTVQSFVCSPYGNIALLHANPAIQCTGAEHIAMLSWSIPFFAIFVVAVPFIIAGRMFELRSMQKLNRWITVEFLQAAYKSHLGDDKGDFYEQCQTNFEVVLLARRIVLTALVLYTDSLCTSSYGICMPKVVGINAIRFFSMLIQ